MASLKIDDLDGGTLAHAVLEAGRGNVLTRAVCAELDAALGELAKRPRLKALVLGAAGSNFSYGASVEEHLPAAAAEMLKGFHRLLGTLIRFPVPVVAAVQGKCLGGGLELALACHRIVAASNAELGQPEIKLGVLAPAATALLPERLGRPLADEMLLGGDSVPAARALAIGLVDEVVMPGADPAARAIEWARACFGALPPAVLRTAHRACRAAWAEAAAARIAEMEALYVREVVPSRDALEGLTAFLEKRPPQWRSDGG